MKSTKINLIGMAILTGISLPAYSATDTKVVIGQNTSQITEQASLGTPLSFEPILSSFIPFDGNNNSVTQSREGTLDWEPYLNQKIQITSKYRDLNFSGTLASTDNMSITLKSNGSDITLPANDFYLTKSNKQNTVPSASDGLSKLSGGHVTYETNELSWTPSLTLVFDQNNVSVIQQALVSNRSYKNQNLIAPYLNYRPQGTVGFEMKEARVMAMADSAAQPTYQENQVTYRLDGQYRLPPASETMLTLSNQTYPIDSKVNVASVYGYPNSSTVRQITFNQTINFTLKEESVSGNYKTLWLQNERYIGGQPVSIQSARTNQKVEVVTNRSLDLTGTLKLINATSRKLPATQLWELEVKNHSNSSQVMSFVHQTNGIVNSIHPANVATRSGNALVFDRSLVPNETYRVRYEIRVTE